MSARQFLEGQFATLREVIRGEGSVEQETIEGYLFAAPYLALFAIFLAYPLLKGLYMSFFNWNPIFPSRSTFVGLQNYVEMFNNPMFWQGLKGTVVFVILTVVPIVVLGLLIALGINYLSRGSKFLRAIFFSPYLLTVSVVALVWVSFVAPSYGAINYYLDYFVAQPPAWLDSYLFAMPTVAVTTIWWQVGFSFVIFLAARQSVPNHLYEAAKIDGAHMWRMFRDITLPQMRESVLFVTIVQFVFQFQVFGQVYIMTNGGPGNATLTLVLHLYRAAFQAHNFGYAAAVGYFIVIVLSAVSLANYWLIGSDNE